MPRGALAAETGQVSEEALLLGVADRLHPVCALEKTLMLGKIEGKKGRG